MGANGDASENGEEKKNQHESGQMVRPGSLGQRRGDGDSSTRNLEQKPCILCSRIWTSIFPLTPLVALALGSYLRCGHKDPWEDRWFWTCFQCWNCQQVSLHAPMGLLQETLSYAVRAQCTNSVEPVQLCVLVLFTSSPTRPANVTLSIIKPFFSKLLARH